MKTVSSLNSKVLACLTMAGLLSTPTSGFSARDVAAASEPLASTSTATDVEMITAGGALTFTTRVVCQGETTRSPLVILDIEGDHGAFGSILILAQPSQETVFDLTFDLTNSSSPARERLLASRTLKVTLSYSNCRDTFFDRLQVADPVIFDGPLVLLASESVAIRQGAFPTDLKPLTYTFSNGEKVLRQGDSSLYLEEPTCTVRGMELEKLLSYEAIELALEEVFKLRIVCEGGTLKPDEAWRSGSITTVINNDAGHLITLPEHAWALAANHYSNVSDDARFTGAKVPFVLPAGAKDAIYVLSQNGEGPANPEQEHPMYIGALVSNGRSLSDDLDCTAVRQNFNITTSSTSRMAVAASMPRGFVGRSAELLRFSFDDETAQCDYAFPERRITNPIRSLVIEDADNVLALHGALTIESDSITISDSIISRITFPEPDPDPDADLGLAPRQDFAFDRELQLQGIVSDSSGNLWGVSQIAGAIKIWKLILVPPVLSGMQSGPIFSDASWSTHSFTIQDDDAQEQEPPVGSVIAEEWLTFDDNDELVGFEARGHILTVSSKDSDSWGSGFTSVRSFDARDKSVVAQMQSKPGDDCDDFFGIEYSCGGYLLGVDAINGVALIDSWEGYLGRTGPSASQAVTQLSEAWTFFGSDFVNRGTLSNDGEHAWLFNSDDAYFERIALAIPESPPVTENTSVNSGAISFVGPMIEPIRSPVRVGSEIVLRGQRLGTISSLKIGEVAQTLTSKSETELRFKIEANTMLGVNDIVLVSSFGTMTLQSHVTILGSRDRGPLTNSVTNPLIGTTKMLSRSSVNNQRWFKANLEDLDVGRILCTAMVRVNATEQQKRKARTLARTTCSQAAAFLDAPKVSIRVRETTTAKMPGRVMIGFRN